MNRATQLSYVILLALLALLVWLKLGTLLLTALFGYLALQKFSFHGSKAVSITLYVLAVIVVLAGTIYFAGLAYSTFPRIAEMAIPAMVEFAERHGIDLPFTDYASLKTSALTEAKEGIATIGRYARIASIQSVLLLAGLVVALGVFLNPSWTAGSGEEPQPEKPYSAVQRELGLRFRNLYDSFSRVIGAQIVISSINTALTAIFLLICGYRYTALLLSMVFLCGLIPIAGNLISNTMVVGVGFILSPRMGIIALIFLVSIHKLEYVLNSKIIGKRIDSPMWLTLIGLVVGERLMGITGMVLAPVLLNYIKLEANGNRTSISEQPPSTS